MEHCFKPRRRNLHRKRRCPMSAALQLPMLWAAQSLLQTGPIEAASGQIQSGLRTGSARGACAGKQQTAKTPPDVPAEPLISYAFYRKHTENMLRRYLYASMQIGRSPCLLSESVDRGWASSRTIRTFEDALIFVLDVERCLQKLTPLDRQLITRVVLQEYTQAEAASLLGICSRSICTKLPLALDHLTEFLVASRLLLLPD